MSVRVDPTDHSVRLVYHFAPGTLLAFTGEDAWQETVRRDWWKRDEECFQLEGNGVRLGTAARCVNASIRLDWDERDRPRTYPALVRMVNGGFLVYAGYIEVLAPDRRTRAEIRLEAPQHGVASFRDRKSSSQMVLDPSTFGGEVSGWFYLGPDRFHEEPAARVLADDGVPPELRRIVVDLAPRLMDLYANGLGVAYPTRPTFFFHWSARERPFPTSQADVVPGGDVRFGVAGSAWRDTGRKEAAQFAYAAAHELAHLWNMDVFHHPDWASAWLHEGNAELLSTAALLAVGEINALEAADRVAAAAMECDLYARSRAWKDMPERERDRIPYACGLAFQFGIVAAASRDRAQLNVFDYWRELWARHPKYYEAVFAQDALSHGDDALARLLQEMLTGPLSVEDALRRLYSLGHLTIDVPGPLGPKSRGIAARRIMSNVMQLDCGLSVNYVDYQDRFEVVDNGTPRRCGALINGMQVAKFEGLDVTREPLEIGRRLESRCRQEEPITVATPGGKSVAIPCSPRWARRVALDAIKLDPAQVAALLGASTPRP